MVGLLFAVAMFLLLGVLVAMVEKLRAKSNMLLLLPLCWWWCT
jgi:hypothetical protein